MKDHKKRLMNTRIYFCIRAEFGLPFASFAFYSNSLFEEPLRRKKGFEERSFHFQRKRLFLSKKSILSSAG